MQQKCGNTLRNQEMDKLVLIRWQLTITLHARWPRRVYRTKTITLFFEQIMRKPIKGRARFHTENTHNKTKNPPVDSPTNLASHSNGAMIQVMIVFPVTCPHVFDFTVVIEHKVHIVSRVR